MVGSTKITVPDGWQVVNLGQIAYLRKRTVKAIEGDLMPYIALEHINSNGTLKSYGKAGDSISPKTAFSKGDTLYGKLRPNLRKVVRVDTDGVCSTDILAVYGNDLVDNVFLSYLLRGDSLYEHAMKGITGTRMPRTSWNHLQTFRLLLPPLTQQRNIATLMDSIDKVIGRTEMTVTAAKNLRDSLLHELFSHGIPGLHKEWRNVTGVGMTPVDWKLIRLGEVCGSPKYGTILETCPYDPTLPRYVRITDIGDYGQLCIEGARSVRYDGSEYKLDVGDLLFSVRGSIGRTYLYKSKDGVCVYSGNLMRFRPNRLVILPEFVSCYTHSFQCQRWIASMSRWVLNLA